MNIEKIESRALVFGVIINLVMATAGWTTYYFSNSEAVLLDGNFSFIASITTLIAIFIAKRKHIKTINFPFGSYGYESFFVLFKGILILGIIISAVTQNVVKMIDYFNDKDIQQIDTSLIMYYSILMVFLCFILAFYYNYQNKKTKYKSSILTVESKSAIVDGFLSLAVGIALVGIALTPQDSIFHFLLYIGDALIVVTLGLAMINIPIQIIRDAFIELGGGILQDKNLTNKIENIIDDNIIPEFKQISNYITKLGSNYFVIIYNSSINEIINIKKINNLKVSIQKALTPCLPSLDLEIIVKE